MSQFRVFDPTLKGILPIAPGEECVSQGVLGVDLDSPFEPLASDGIVCLAGAVEVLDTPTQEVPGLQVARVLAMDAHLLAGGELDLQGGDDVLRDLVL